jgi:hypothetical protein
VLAREEDVDDTAEESIDCVVCSVVVNAGEVVADGSLLELGVEAVGVGELVSEKGSVDEELIGVVGDSVVRGSKRQSCRGLGHEPFGIKGLQLLVGSSKQGKLARQGHCALT